MTPILFAFPGMEPLAAAIASHWPLELGRLSWRHFPDGESLLGLEGDCTGRDAIVLCSFRDPDALALPLLFAARTAREFGARRVGLIAPYLAYLRQDRRFNPGEAISAIHFGAFLSSTVDWLVTVDPHLHRLASLDAVLSIPARAVSAMPAIADWVRANVSDPVLIGPDSESAQWVEQVAAQLRVPAIVLDKTRHGDRKVEVSPPDAAAVAGRTPVLIDDIVSSGHTLLETLARLRQLGLPAAICAVVHGVFAERSDQALLAAGAARVISTNTLPHPSNAIDVSAPLADAAKALLAQLHM